MAVLLLESDRGVDGVYPRSTHPTACNHPLCHVCALRIRTFHKRSKVGLHSRSPFLCCSWSFRFHQRFSPVIRESHLNTEVFSEPGSAVRILLRRCLCLGPVSRSPRLIIFWSSGPRRTLRRKEDGDARFVVKSWHPLSSLKVRACVCSLTVYVMVSPALLEHSASTLILVVALVIELHLGNLVGETWSEWMLISFNFTGSTARPFDRAALQYLPKDAAQHLYVLSPSPAGCLVLFCAVCVCAWVRQELAG